MHSRLLNTEVLQWIKFLTVRKEHKDKMAKIRITQVKSKNGKPERQKRTIEALGIHKLNHSVEHEATPQILGMVVKVRHLVKVENI
jgi:large subunit ribosomal protein L30